MTMTQETKPRPQRVMLFTTVLTASPAHCHIACQFMSSGKCALPSLPGEEPALVPLKREGDQLKRAPRCLSLTGKRG